MLRIPVIAPSVPSWIRDAAIAINGLLGRMDAAELFKAPEYTVATLPTATVGKVIYVSNEIGGAVLAFGDGTNFRRVTDRAIVS